MKKVTPFRRMTGSTRKREFAKEVEKQQREVERARIQRWLEMGKDALVTEPPQDDDDKEAA